jgi:hypothetical protein
MNVLQLLLVTGLLIGLLIWVERISRPKSEVAERIARMAIQVEALAVLIGNQLTPAVEKAAVAIDEFNLAFQKKPS